MLGIGEVPEGELAGAERSTLPAGEPHDAVEGRSKMLLPAANCRLAADTATLRLLLTDG